MPKSKKYDKVAVSSPKPPDYRSLAAGEKPEEWDQMQVKQNKSASSTTTIGSIREAISEKIIDEKNVFKDIKDYGVENDGQAVLPGNESTKFKQQKQSQSEKIELAHEVDEKFSEILANIQTILNHDRTPRLEKCGETENKLGLLAVINAVTESIIWLLETNHSIGQFVYKKSERLSLVKTTIKETLDAQYKRKKYDDEEVSEGAKQETVKTNQNFLNQKTVL